MPDFCTAEGASAAKRAPIRQMLASDVLAFDCGSSHRTAYPSQKAVPGTHMPTLDAFLTKFRDNKVLLFVETKMPGPNEGIVDPVAFTKPAEAKVRKYGLEDRFILQSFDWRTIDAMHAINPRIRTCLFGANRAKTDYLELVRQHHAGCIVLATRDTNAAQVRQLRDAGVLLFSSVVDDEQGWRAYLGLGMDGLFTNYPGSADCLLEAG